MKIKKIIVIFVPLLILVGLVIFYPSVPIWFLVRGNAERISGSDVFVVPRLIDKIASGQSLKNNNFGKIILSLLLAKKEKNIFADNFSSEKNIVETKKIEESGDADG